MATTMRTATINFHMAAPAKTNNASVLPKESAGLGTERVEVVGSFAVVRRITCSALGVVADDDALSLSLSRGGDDSPIISPAGIPTVQTPAATAPFSI